MKVFKQIIYSIPILTVWLCFSSCYYDKVVPVEETVDVGDVSFLVDIVPIFNQSCNVSGCHNGSVAPDLRETNAYGALMNNDYINTGNPESSELYQWMKGNKSLPMPLIGSNATYNAKILAWIKQGALNN
jgi:hypothetical protein